jgi:putative nucleotidyltransferase with HDIG domain
LKASGARSFLVLPLFVDHRPFGALICTNDGSAPLGDDEVRHARQVADQLAVAFSNLQLFEALQEFQWGTLSAFARAIDAKSSWTAGHSERVTAMAVRIGKAMGLGRKDLEIMQRGGLLHDIGKIGTPASLLDKPGKLDSNELQMMHEHVRIGLRILEPIPAFKEALPIVAQHHEWFNGKGYPEGLAGEAISLHARIFAVADCYDALISDRPYRKGLPKSRVVQMLREGSGLQFDPKVIDAFVRMYEAEDSQLPAMPVDFVGKFV